MLYCLFRIHKGPRTWNMRQSSLLLKDLCNIEAKKAKLLMSLNIMETLGQRLVQNFKNLSSYTVNF